MDPKAANMQAAMQSFMAAMADLDIQYIELMQRLGVKNFRLFRI